MLRLLGGVGLGLCALLVLGTWGLTLTLGPKLGGYLAQADAALGTLDSNLTGLIDALEPLDLLARPETLDAVRALAHLAGQVEDSPFAGLLLGENAGMLDQWQAKLGTWESVLQNRPSVPALREQQAEVRLWLGRVHLAQSWLTPSIWLLNLSALALGAWFAAGQWALLRLANERLEASFSFQTAQGTQPQGAPAVSTTLPQKAVEQVKNAQKK